MNPATFKSMLTPEMGTNNVTDTDHAAQLLADAYDLANIGSSCTFFGSTVISGDKDTLKKFIKLAFDTNKTTNTKDGFMLMATGFCAYWLKAVFTPLPTLPPTISPLKGTTVLFPGEPTELEKDLIKAFDQPEFEMFTDTLYNALVAHHTKIAGTYNGLVPAFPSPIPAILPWVAILSAPLPDTGTSGTSGISGTKGTAGTSGTFGTGETSGTSGTFGTSGTNGTSGTSGTFGTNGTSGTSGTSGTFGTNGTSGTFGTNGTSGTFGTFGSGDTGMGGFKTNGVSDYRVKLRLSNIVRSVDGRYNADWIVRFALSDFPRPVPDSIKRDIAFNTKLQKEIGNLTGQEMNRLYYIFDYMIEQKNLELDSVTGYVKYGSVKITQ